MKLVRKYIQFTAIITGLLLVVNDCEAQDGTISFSVKTTNKMPLEGHRALNPDYYGMVHDSIYHNQQLPNFIMNQFENKQYKVYEPEYDKDSLNRPPRLSMQALKDRIGKETEGRTRTVFSLDFNEKWILDTISTNIKRQTLSMAIREQSKQTYKREDGSNLIIAGENTIATMYYKRYSPNRIKKIYERSQYTGLYLTEVLFRDTSSFFYKKESRMIFLKALMKGIQKGKYRVKRRYDNEVLNYNDFVNYVTDDDPAYFNKLLANINELFFLDHCYVDPNTLYVHKEIKSIILFGTMEIEMNSKYIK